MGSSSGRGPAEQVIGLDYQFLACCRTPTRRGLVAEFCDCPAGKGARRTREEMAGSSLLWLVTCPEGGQAVGERARVLGEQFGEVICS